MVVTLSPSFFNSCAPSVSNNMLTMRQASFVALNIEPEDDSEDEIDDSEEIQVAHQSCTWLAAGWKSNAIID